MSSNDVILLEDMINRSRTEMTGLSVAEQEAYFVSKHYLRLYRPGHDDLLAGIVDGSNDGGLDAAYIFVNGYCVRDDTDLSALGRNVQMDLIFLQVKNSKGFSESAIDKMFVHLPLLLDFARDEQVLAKRFNGKVIEITRRFLNAYRSLDMPNLSIFCAFGSLRAEVVHENVVSKGEFLAERLKESFGSSTPGVHFLDAASIADMARDRPSTSRELALAENPISTDTAGGYIGVVKLDEYQRFITDDSGKLDASLFEANVRDYEGETGVNRSIQTTLEHEDRDVDFWWLNNGVTIVADKVQPASKLLALESPQIVNGLQTSHEIFKRGAAHGFTENRSVLVKVIQAADDRVKDRIIQATNSQTALGLSALRATDKVQRQIEEHLRSQGLFYERRKNYYQNRSIPLAKLVSIDQMGQAVMSTLVQVPHVARGQASKIFDEEIYGDVFNESYPIQMYSVAITLLRRTEEFLRNSLHTRGNVDDFVFHLAMLCAVAMTRKMQPKANDLADSLEIAGDRLLRQLLPLVQEEFKYVAGRRGEVLLEKVAKDPMTSERLRERAQRYLLSSPRS
ncbi:AIPR family protein [Kribbella sp. NPDC048928]|uniref:AIPR family protein n=1 Tax=Kribbella sp. NPDC048928 TaxID=3364111 RepID=UPI00371A144D